MPHPGILLDKLRKDAGIKKIALALRCEVSITHLSNILRGSLPITLRVARMLEREGFGNAKQWMKLQDAFEHVELDTSPAGARQAISRTLVSNAKRNKK